MAELFVQAQYTALHVTQNIINSNLIQQFAKHILIAELKWTNITSELTSSSWFNKNVTSSAFRLNIAWTNGD